MADSFTDELIKDLNKSEEDAGQFRVSRWAVLREVVKDMWDSSAELTFLVLVVGPIVFGLGTYTLISSSSRIPIVEARVFQIFEVRGISIEIMSLRDPILSEVVEEVEGTFSEFIELATERGMVYFSRSSRNRFFVVDKYWDVINYYDNSDIVAAYTNRRLSVLVSPLSGIVGVAMLVLMYRSYRSKYKEMAGL